MSVFGCETGSHTPTHGLTHLLWPRDEHSSQHSISKASMALSAGTAGLIHQLINLFIHAVIQSLCASSLPLFPASTTRLFY